MTADLLNDYKEMIQNTAVDLEELLHGIDDQTKSKTSRVPASSANNDDCEDEEHSIKEERASTQQCLRICEELSAHIDQVQAKDLADMSTPSDEHHASIELGGITLARLTTSKNS